jgi:hypothetical protein
MHVTACGTVGQFLQHAAGCNLQQTAWRVVVHQWGVRGLDWSSIMIIVKSLLAGLG